MWFSYDHNDKVISFRYKKGSASIKTYYYVRNAQGDIIGIYNENGYMAAYYNYGNAYGASPTVTIIVWSAPAK